MDVATQELLENVLLATPGNVYWKNKQGEFLGCNSNVAQILGLHSPTDIIGKTNHDVLSPALAKDADAVDKRVFVNGETVIVEEQGWNINKEPAIYLSTKSPLRNTRNQIIGLIGTAIDITARKAAEAREKIAVEEGTRIKAQAEAEEQLRQVLMVQSGAMSHDLRAPISGMIVQLNLLEQHWPILVDGYLKAQTANLPLLGTAQEQAIVTDYVTHKRNIGQLFKEAVQTMDNLITDALKTLRGAFAKTVNKEYWVRCDIWKCLQNTLALYPESTENRRHIHVGDVEHLFDFMGNELFIMRVLANLINNALDQIKQNQRGAIFISTGQDERNHILRIRDTAGGVPLEIQSQLFEPYFTTKNTGTGIGLAFCKLTMQNFGGDITCHSVAGDYAEFILTFPKTHC